MRRENVLAVAMLVACEVLGGGGTSNPTTEVLLELVLPLLVVAALWWPRQTRDRHTHPTRASPIPLAALAIAALVALIPIVQLIPLAPAIWHGLPGRQAEVSALSLIGAADRWMPISLTPARTFAAFLAIVAELAVFLAAARLDLAGRRSLYLTIVAVAIASVLLGSLQLSSAGGYTWSIYSRANFGWLFGFYSNRNAATDGLQVGVMALAATIAGTAHRQPIQPLQLTVLMLVMLGLALGAVLTGSRTGITLLPLTYLVAVWILWPTFRQGIGRRTMWLAVVLPPLVGLVLTRSGQVQHALGRFDGHDDRRWQIWHDTMTAIHSVWPLGGGISSFQVMYDATQSIERLSSELDSRVHNDWLEWVLESGLPGLGVLALIVVIMLLCNIRALRIALRRGGDPEYRAQVIFATGALLQIALHGVFDYPMRSMALAALVGTAAALLMPIRAAQGGSQ